MGNKLEETTPLLSRRGGGQHRRQNHHQQDRIANGPQIGYSDTMSDFEKIDRRSRWGKLTSALSTSLSQGASRATTTTTNAAAHCTVIDTTLDEDDYYIDTFNDQPWNCTFGTKVNDGTWINTGDQVGTLMCSMVWVLIGYSCLTITLLAHEKSLPAPIAMVYMTICALALASHVKTTLTDPGAIPQEAIPMAFWQERGITTHAMCSHCQTYKPPASHHCRICNRCISRMDHHCPWMNNCVGAGNFKFFILFLCYTWTGCAFALLLFAANYFFCADESCTFSLVLVQLVRVMTLLCIATLLFVSSMLMNVTYGILTGIGTIDRLKKKATNTVYISDEEPLPLKDIFGVQGIWTWPLPIDPVFEDYERVMGYTIPARVYREQERAEIAKPASTR